MSQSALDAIRSGKWDYEPLEIDERLYSPTVANPGTREKVEVLAERAAAGLPLWHGSDQEGYGKAD